jgi:hypothetical protein
MDEETKRAQIELYEALRAQLYKSKELFKTQRHPLTGEPNPESDEFLRGYQEAIYTINHICGVLGLQR